LGLPLIDKDQILERLFETKGVGDVAWRQALSRESDKIFIDEAETSNGAVLVSFWRVLGMTPDSGTPLDRLTSFPGRFVNLHCTCDPEVAARRFLQRKRHPGHLDGERSYSQILGNFRQLALLKPLETQTRVCIDTSQEPNITDLVREVRLALYPEATA
jgi:glucokinase